MPSLSVRIRYHTAENSSGECGLNFSSNTKKDFRETFQRYRINPDDVILFEVKKDGKWEVRPLEKLHAIFEGNE